MAHANQIANFKRLNPTITGPILEVGSAIKSSSSPFRGLFPDQSYTGIDLEQGPGVDRIVDIVAGIGDLPINHYGLVLCVSALEHMTRPWMAAEHMTQLLRPEGFMYLSVPWVWRWHGYPSDYWRISVSGIKQLFPGVQWLDFAYSTLTDGEIFPLTERDIPDVENKLRKDKRFPYISVEALGRKS